MKAGKGRSSGGRKARGRSSVRNKKRTNRGKEHSTLSIAKSLTKWKQSQPTHSTGKPGVTDSRAEQCISGKETMSLSQAEKRIPVKRKAHRRARRIKPCRETVVQTISFNPAPAIFQPPGPDQRDEFVPKSRLGIDMVSSLEQSLVMKRKKRSDVRYTDSVKSASNSNKYAALEDSSSESSTYGELEKRLGKLDGYDHTERISRKKRKVYIAAPTFQPHLANRATQTQIDSSSSTSRIKFEQTFFPAAGGEKEEETTESTSTSL